MFVSFLKKILNKINFVTSQNLSKLFRSKIKKINPRIENDLLKDERINFNFNQIYFTNISPYWIHFKSQMFFSKFIIVERNCEIIGKGLVVREDGKVNMESCLFQDEYLKKLSINHLVVLRKLIPSKKLEKVISLSNYLEKGYYHWILECLGKLTFATKEQLRDYKIFIGRNPSSFMIESLNTLFGITQNQIIIGNSIRYKVKECLIISNPHHRNENTKWTNIHKPSVMRKLNEIASQNAEKDKVNNLIISRSSAKQRRIYGEEKIVEEFPEYNFQIVKLEELSFKEQIHLFYNANLVIGTHGAGFTNMIFSKNISLIEFFPTVRKMNSSFCFTEISSALDFKHYLIGYEADNYKNQDLHLNSSHLNQIKKVLSN